MLVVHQWLTRWEGKIFLLSHNVQSVREKFYRLKTTSTTTKVLLEPFQEECFFEELIFVLELSGLPRIRKRCLRSFCFLCDLSAAFSFSQVSAS